MELRKHIKLKSMMNAAEGTFNSTRSSLESIENGFDSRMNGKSMGGMIGNIIITIVWILAFVGFFVLIYNNLEEYIFYPTVISAALLLLFLFIDDVVNVSYYGKIASFRQSTSHLKERLSIGKSSFNSNLDTFMGAEKDDWNLQLQISDSIMQDAHSIQQSASAIKSLKNGFINTAKNIFFFTTGALVTVAGGRIAFDMLAELMDGAAGIFDKEISANVAYVICVIGLIITIIGEIILSKLVWSKTDCTVTNLTMLITVAGPLLFLVLMLLVTLVVMIVVGILYLIFILLAIAAGIAVLYSVSSGG